MRKFLLLGVAGAALVLASSASQAGTISYQILDGATVIGSGSSTTGSILLSGSDSNFSLVSGVASGAPALTSPNFSTNNFTLSNGGAAGTLTIRVTETGLATYAGNIQNTFTLNSLTADTTFLTGTISNYFDASNAAYGTATQIGTASFSGIGAFSAQNTASTSFVTPFSETTIYTLNFRAGNSSSMSSSAQLVATPEPASLAIIGAGLAAVGFVRRRRQSV